jgi:hypothetical protein
MVCEPVNRSVKARIAGGELRRVHVGHVGGDLHWPIGARDRAVQLDGHQRLACQHHADVASVVLHAHHHGQPTRETTHGSPSVNVTQRPPLRAMLDLHRRRDLTNGSAALSRGQSKVSAAFHPSDSLVSGPNDLSRR